MLKCAFSHGMITYLPIYDVMFLGEEKPADTFVTPDKIIH